MPAASAGYALQQYQAYMQEDKEAWVARLLMALFLVMLGVALIMH